MNEAKKQVLRQAIKRDAQELFWIHFDIDPLGETEPEVKGGFNILTLLPRAPIQIFFDSELRRSDAIRSLEKLIELIRSVTAAGQLHTETLQ